ncbi:FBX46 protein, partial [Aegotheles bennettii]|nr:FBX46 protein [Aegotheles bennettii]
GGGRATTMKVKGNWANESSKAKRRRRCHDATTVGKESPTQLATSATSATSEAPDLLSVAEMVALVERRTALALQNFQPRPCGGGGAIGGSTTSTTTTMGSLEDLKAPNGSSSVAEAVARFESRHRGGDTRPNGLCQPTSATTTTTTTTGGGPGEVRIAFRISSAREANVGTSTTTTSTTTTAGRPGCVFMSCGGGGGGGTKDKITCDLYQLISPSRDALPNNVEFLLATAVVPPPPKGDNVDTEMVGCGEGSGATNVTAGDLGEATNEATSGRDCSSSFHVDVVVTGVVDQCVFFGKDSAKKMKEETVKLPAQEDPPPGQLFLLPTTTTEEAPAVEDTEVGEEPVVVAPPDPSLCRLYRHVSHDFLEIRFKIQRLLEPRQYMLLLPEHVMVKIFSYLPTHALAALKCSCHYFKSIIETFGVQATDSRWNRDPLYRDDPCKQCKKHYEKGDVSLCRWHPKPYHHDLPYGRSYWMCCRRPDKEAPGCKVGLHDNNWVHPATARREDAR